MEKLLILWADDQREFVEAMRVTIADITEDIRYAHDADAALQLAEAGGCDLALVDLQMPPGQWGGLDMIRRMSEKRMDLPIIVLSGMGSVRQFTQALRLGATNYVEKEFASDDLRPAILDAIEKVNRQKPLSDYDIIRRLENQVHRAVIGSLRALAKEKGTDIFRIMPRESATKSYERMLEDTSGAAQETFLDLLDLRKIINDNWNSDSLYTRLEDILKPKNKEARTKWLSSLNEIRKVVAHPMRGDLDESQRRELRAIEDIVTRWLTLET